MVFEHVFHNSSDCDCTELCELTHKCLHQRPLFFFERLAEFRTQTPARRQSKSTGRFSINLTNPTPIGSQNRFTDCDCTICLCQYLTRRYIDQLNLKHTTQYEYDPETTV